MRRRMVALLVPALLAAGCVHPAEATTPPATAEPAITEPPTAEPTTGGAHPAGTNQAKPGKTHKTTAATVQKSAPSKARGGIVFDPFETIRCTWVPNLFVDLGGGDARPGIDLRIPLWAAQLDSTVKVRIRSEVNGTGYKTTATVTADPPEWRGSVHMAFPPPANGDTISVATELDTGGALAGTTPESSRRTVEGRLPTPLPDREQSFACQRVN